MSGLVVTGLLQGFQVQTGLRPCLRRSGSARTRSYSGREAEPLPSIGRHKG